MRKLKVFLDVVWSFLVGLFTLVKWTVILVGGLAAIWFVGGVLIYGVHLLFQTDFDDSMRILFLPFLAVGVIVGLWIWGEHQRGRSV